MSQKGWTGYAIGKAIWGYEPGYAESQGETPGAPSLLQEKECLTNLMAANDANKDKDKDMAKEKDKDAADKELEVEHEMEMLDNAKEYKMIDGFAYYEMLLRQKPAMVYQLPNNVIKSIKNYVVMAHGGETPQKRKK